MGGTFTRVSDANQELRCCDEFRQFVPLQKRFLCLLCRTDRYLKEMVEYKAKKAAEASEEEEGSEESD